MTLVLIGLSVGTAVSLALLPPLIRLLPKLRAVDEPDARRKLHDRAVPRGGGLAVLAGLTAAVAVLGVLARYDAVAGAADLWGAAGGRLLTFLAAAFVLSVVGFADDTVGLRGRQKLFGQCLAAGVLVAGGTVIRRVGLGGMTVDLGVAAVPFTAFFLLGAVNAVNLLDGIDGLASTVGAVLGAAICVLCLLGSPGGHLAEAVLAAALVGGLLAFLVFNFPPASVFLGDTGSMLIGLTLGFTAIHASLKGAATFALAAPLAIWAVPILDVSMAIVRRKLTGRSLYTTDRGHLHHSMLERGLGNRAILLLVSLLCAVTAAGALLSVSTQRDWVAAVSVGAVVLLMAGTRLFGHREFGLLWERGLSTGRSLLPGLKRPEVRGGAERRTHLRGVRDWNPLWDKLWGCLTDYAEHHALTALHLDVNHPALREDWSAHWASAEKSERNVSWNADVPLIADDGVAVGRLRVSGRVLSRGEVSRAVSDLLGTVAGFEREFLDLLAADPARTPAEPAAVAPDPGPAAASGGAPDADPVWRADGPGPGNRRPVKDGSHHEMPLLV